MKFGIFEHMDASGRPLAQQFEERLKLIEAYDRSAFTLIISLSTTARL